MIGTETEQVEQTAETHAEKSEKSNTHWRTWEYGCLVDMCVEGKSFSTIGETLTRTAAACLRMWKRLLAGDAECPTVYRANLEEARQKFKTLQKPAARPKPTGYEAMLSQVNEQYRQLAKNDGDLAAKISDVEKLLTYSLAIDVANGRLTGDEVGHFCPPNDARIVMAMAEHIRQFRNRERGLYDDPPTEADTMEGADKKPDEEKPLVKTGPGGDFTKDTKPSDV